ncbi:uncharacterized protein LOC129744780 [Uranotaenia lowii]|uniref:uncharacterized protein LOC129744780 n=1 Tax=Uranotaenia lowii TaxID=190385 RepID=UPI0024799BD3|nr:uncharacterized protein LOC129744780 [Uranotaenia lowii]
MFQTITRAIRPLVKPSHWRNPVLASQTALYSTFHPREFQFEKSDGEAGTLIHRFSRHIALNKRDFTDPTQYNLQYSSFYPIYNPKHFLKELKSVTTHDLGKLICLTADFRGKADVRLLTDVLNSLDEEAESRVPEATFNELLGLLHGFMYLLPNKITKLQTYRLAMPRLVELFSSNPNEKDFMSLLFFIGLWKKNAAGSRMMDQFLAEHLSRFLTDQLELFDFVMLANASYKTSVRIQDESFRNRLQQEIERFDDKGDMALLVTLVKCARMNRLKSDAIVERIRTLIQSCPKDLDFRGLSHLFAYVADNHIKDDDLTELFLAEGSKRMEETILNPPSDPLAQNCRAKDVATYLWSCATLGIDIQRLSLDPKDLLEDIHRRIDAEEYRFMPDTLVDTCLSLWMIGHPSVDLLASVFGDRLSAQHFKRGQPKVESRKDLLLACAEIERPEAFKIISKLPMPNAFELARECPEYLVKSRDGLLQVKACLDEAKNRLKIAEVRFNVPIKFLNIAGLLVKLENGEQITVEVLDEPYLLTDGQTISGFMKLKLRLLEQMQVKSITLNLTNNTTQEEMVKVVESALQNLTPVEKPKRRGRKSG